MMLKILLHNFIRDLARAPRPVPDCPEVTAPVALSQTRIFLLQDSRRTSFQALDQIRKRYFWRIFDVHMDVVTTYYAAEDSHILSIANLHQQLATSNFYVALQNVITIFRCPHQMRCETRRGVSAFSVLFHLSLI